MKALVSVILILLGIEDLRTQKISFWLLIVLIILSTIYSLIKFSPLYCLLGALPGAALIAFAWMQQKAIGIGDGLITMVYGLIYGWRHTCVWLMFSFLLVAVVGLCWKAISKRRELRLPLIPFMAVVHMGMCL